MESPANDHPLLQLTQLAESAVSMFFESLAPLHDVIHAPDVAEVMINRHDSIWVERRGVLTKLDVVLEPFKVEGAVAPSHPPSKQSAAQSKASSMPATKPADRGVMQPTALMVTR
jgi:hypothetical protein